MTRRRRTPAWLRIGFTVLTLALALLLIGSAVDLYLRGLALRQEDPAAVIYRPEAVGERLKLLLPGFVLWLAALAAVLAFHGGESNQSSLIGRAVQPAKAPEDKPAVPTSLVPSLFAFWIFSLSPPYHWPKHRPKLCPFVIPCILPLLYFASVLLTLC